MFIWQRNNIRCWANQVCARGKKCSTRHQQSIDASPVPRIVPESCLSLTAGNAILARAVSVCVVHALKCNSDSDTSNCDTLGGRGPGSRDGGGGGKWAVQRRRPARGTGAVRRRWRADQYRRGILSCAVHRRGLPCKQCGGR